MNAPAQAAIGAGNDVFAADDVGEGEDAVGHQFGVLDEIGGVADDSGNENFSGRQLYVSPDFVFMFVADVAGFSK